MIGTKDDLMTAARALVVMTRRAALAGGAVSTAAELELEIKLAGVVETWKITIERTASGH